MRAMSLPTLCDEVFEAAVRLPVGATLIVPEIDWDDYERLLDQIEGERHLRLTYDCGRLEIMSPGPEHGKYPNFIDDLVRAFCDRRKIELEKLGNTTWKKRASKKGVEADCCYYIANAERVIGKREIKLEVDPLPDIVVEIDLSTDSSRKFHIYAALGVSEIWIYDGDTVVFHSLNKGRYTESASSRFLPALSGPLLAEALKMSKSVGQTKALNAFRRKLRALN
jgi:Uma2 family endonuclease